MIRFILTLSLINLFQLSISPLQAKLWPTDTVVSQGYASITIQDMHSFLKTFNYLFAYDGKLYPSNEVKLYLPSYCHLSELNGYPYALDYIGRYTKYARGEYIGYEIVFGDDDMNPELFTVNCNSIKKNKDLTEAEIINTFSSIGIVSF